MTSEDKKLELKIDQRGKKSSRGTKKNVYHFSCFAFSFVLPRLKKFSSSKRQMAEKVKFPTCRENDQLKKVKKKSLLFTPRGDI